MKKSVIAVAALFMGGVLALGIAIAPQEAEQERPRDHPLLQGLTPPPVNMPIRLPTGPREQVRPQLPDDGEPVLLIVRDGAPFTGTVQQRGRFAVRDDVIEFRTASEQQSVLRMLYRLPEALEPLARGTFEGTLELQETGGPEGANRQLLVRSNETIQLGEVWQSRSAPLEVALGQRVQLVQTPIAQRTERGQVPVEVQVVDNGEVIATLPVGEATDVQTSEGGLTFYPLTSQYMATGEGQLAQYPDQYTLHVWIRGR